MTTMLRRSESAALRSPNSVGMNFWMVVKTTPPPRRVSRPGRGSRRPGRDPGAAGPRQIASSVRLLILAGSLSRESFMSLIVSGSRVAVCWLARHSDTAS